MKVLTVCSGNTCRSPLAARLLERELPGVEVGSAGVHATAGQPAHAYAIRVAGEGGIDLAGHRSRTLHEAEGSAADVILAMTEGLRSEIVRQDASLASRCLTLGEAAGLPGTEVADPFGSDVSRYSEVFVELSALCHEAAVRLGEPAPLGRVFALASERAGEPVARRVQAWLQQAGIRVERPSGRRADGPSLAFSVGRMVREGQVAGGVVLTGSGIEAAMVTSAMGVRAVLAGDGLTARVARGSFDAQVLCMGTGIVGEDTAADALKMFVRTPFAGRDEDRERLMRAARLPGEDR